MFFNQMKISFAGVMGRAVEYRLEGDLNPGRFTDSYDEILRTAQREGAKGIIFDVRGVLKKPGVFETYEMIEKLETFRKNNLKVAALFEAEMLINDEFALIVAQNRGIQYRRFCERREALQWIEK